MTVLKQRRVPIRAVWIQIFPAALLALLFAAVGVLHVTSRVTVVDAGYRLSALEAQNRQLTLEHDRLELELATLSAPARLEKIARGELGMAPPPASALITVPPATPRASSKLAVRERARGALADRAP